MSNEETDANGIEDIDIADWLDSGKPISEYRADLADSNDSLTEDAREFIDESDDSVSGSGLTAEGEAFINQYSDGRFESQDGHGVFDTEEERQAYDNEKRDEKVAEMRAHADENGIDLQQQVQNVRETTGQLNRGTSTGFEDSYIPNLQENNQSWMADFGEALFEGFILDSAKGIANLIPTVKQAFMENASHSVEKGHDWSKDWSSKWIGTTTAFFDGISPTYSDAYYKGDGYRKLAAGLGQGFGFVGGIMLGGMAGAKVLGKAGMVNKVAKYSKGGELIGAVGAPTKAAQRLASWTTGTTMMYPMVYEEAIAKGIDPAHAARLAFGIAGVVSLTEGAALEAIGVQMSKPLVQKATKEVLKKELIKTGKATSLKEIYALEKNFTKGFAEKLKAVGPKMYKSSAVEMGQEFSQTYIEQGMKEMYDTFVAAEGTSKGKGQFGADVNIFTEEGRKTFDDAIWGGLIGGIVGGSLPAAGMFRGAVEQETLFNYVNKSVRRGDTKKILNLESSIRELETTGKLTPKQATQASDEVKKLVRFGHETKALNLTNDVANFQMYQLSENNRVIKEEIDKNFKASESLPEAVAKTYTGNRKMGAQIVDSINQDMASIIEDKKEFTKNRPKFEKRIQLYNKLASKVYRNEISQEDFNTELESIKTGKTAQPSQQKGKNETKSVEYRTDDKNSSLVTESAMENAESILKDYNEALDNDTESEFQAKLKEEHGIDNKGLRFLAENKDSTVEEMKAKLKSTEVVKETVKGEPKPPKVDDKANELNDARKDHIIKVKAVNELEEKLKDKSLSKKERKILFKEISAAKVAEKEARDKIAKIKDDSKDDSTDKADDSTEPQGTVKEQIIASLEEDLKGTFLDNEEGRKSKADIQSKIDELKAKVKQEAKDDVESEERRRTRGEKIEELKKKHLGGYGVGGFFVYPTENGLKVISLKTGEESNSVHARKAKNQFTVIPGIIKNALSKLSRDTKISDIADLILDYWNVLQEKKNRGEVKSDEDIIADNLFNTKFKNTPDLEGDYKGLSKSWRSEDGIGLNDFVVNYLMAENPEFANRDEQDLMEAVKDFMAQNKNSKEYYKNQKAELEDSVTDIADQFEEITGLRLSEELTRQNEVASQAILDALYDVYYDTYEDSKGETSRDLKPEFYDDARKAEQEEYEKERENYEKETYSKSEQERAEDSGHSVPSVNQETTEETEEELIDSEKLEKLSHFKKESKANLIDVKIYDDGTYEILNESKSIHGDRNADQVRYMAQNMGIKENVKGKDSSVEFNIETKYNEKYIVPLNNLELNKIAEQDNRTIAQLENKILLSGASQTIPEEGESTTVDSIEEAQRRLEQYKEDSEANERETKELEELKYIYSYKVAQEKSKKKKDDLSGIEDAEIIETTEEENEDAVGDAHDFLNDEPINPKEQRASSEITTKETVRQNPALQRKIVKHFRKIFPNIPVKEVERIAAKYGGEVLGRVVEKGIEIDSSRAFQNTIIHEYAHVYIAILGKSDPVIKAGLKLIEDTQYFRDAQKKYPDLSKAGQLEEALAEAIADNSYEKLKVKFDGTTVDKFVAFMKKMWGRIKRKLSKDKGKDIVNIISDGMTFKSKPFVYDTAILNGVNKEQRVNKIAVEATSMIQGYLSRLRMKKIQDPNFLFDPNNSAQVSRFVYDAMKNRYVKEKAGELRDDQINIFDGVSTQLVEEKTKEDWNTNREAIMKLMEDKMNDLFPITQRSIESLSKSPLPTLDEISSDSAVKADKKISESLRAIVTSVIDYDGRPIEADSIYRYVADLASRTYGKKGFKAQLKLDAENNVSVEASRFYEMLGQMPEGIEKSILSELSSLVQTKYRGITLIKDAVTGIARLGSKIVNEDQSMKSKLNDVYRRMESLNDDFGLSEFINAPINRSLLKNKNPESLAKAKEIIENIYDVYIPNETWIDLAEDIAESSKEGWGVSNFMRKLDSVLRGDLKGKDVNTWSKKLLQAVSDKTALSNTFPNMSGNSVSSTNFGYFISEQISMMFNKEGHLDKMKKNPIYRNNPVFRKIVSDFEKTGNKNVDWAVHDALSNMFTDKTIEHSKQFQSDTILIGLSYFANNASKKEYDQSMGISGDRSKTTTVKSPRFEDMAAISEQLKKDAVTQQGIFDGRAKGLSLDSKEYTKLVDNFNSMYMNKVVNGKIVTPTEQSYPTEALADIQKNIATIKEAVRNNKLEDAISKDHVGKGKLYANLNELVGNYYYTEAINRNALMEMFGGVMLDRKSVADLVKRGSGYNSGGTLIEHEKKVVFVAYDVPSEVEEGEFTSDSMSIDGTHLHQHTMDDSGDMGNVGTNKKDFIFQVDPSTGKVFMVKMSTIGIEQNADGTTNFDKMGPEYARMSNAFLKAEKFLAEKYGDDKVHVKFVDGKALKGNDGNYRNDKGDMVKLTDLLNDIENNEFGSLETASFEMEVNNHRVAFDLNKDLSKIPLNMQESTLSSQLRTIASTEATQAEIDSFEGSVVDMLQESLGMTNDDYANSKTNKDVKNNAMFLDNLLKGSDEQKANSLSDLLYEIRDYNEANPGKKITVYDDPNLVNLVQQAIATKYAKEGIRTKMAGAYLHMLPNYGNDLKWYDYENGGIPEVALPMSMFVQKKEGETDAEYTARADKFLADAKENGGLKTVIVRVPASKGMSTFVADVKYFTDPKVNTVIVPDGFIKASDADHDGDKTFVYREDLNDDGTYNKESLKSKAFNKLYERISSEVLVNETKDSLKLDSIKAILEKYDLDQTEGYKLTDVVEAAKIAEQMGFGGDAVGILAIASKQLAMMSQSKESLKEPINFGYKMEMVDVVNEETGEVTQERKGELLFDEDSKEFQNFVNDQGSDMARLLQAALDMGNDPILMSTGINQETISVGTTLTLLGVDTESVIGFLNDPAIVNFNSAVAQANGAFSLGDTQAAWEVRDEYIKDKSPKMARFDDVARLDAHIKLKDGKISNLEEGVYMTKDGKGYFKVTEVNEQGVGSIELINEIKDGDIAVIDKYIKIKEIADNIKKLIPILQLDTKLPNTGAKVTDLSKTLTEIKNDKFPITTESLLSRPLVKHQLEVAKLQRAASKSKFVTEHDMFYALENKFKTPLNRKTKKAVDNSFMQQHAQKSLRNNHSDPKKFIYDFAEEINDIIYSAIVGEPNVADRDWKQDAKAVRELVHEKENNPDNFNKHMASRPEGYRNRMLGLIKKYNDALNDFDKNSKLAENKFINAIQTGWAEETVDDEIVRKDFVLKSKQGFNAASPTVKQEIKDDFLKLPQYIQDNFVDYQLLRNGVNEKMGSLMGMFPNSLGLKVNALASISEVKEAANQDDYLKNKRPLIERNTALSMFNKLNEPQYANRIEGSSDNLLSWNGKDAYIKKGEDIYQRTDETVQVENNRPNIYKKITNNEFVAGKDFTKFGTEESLTVSEITDKEVDEEVKKCKIKK